MKQLAWTFGILCRWACALVVLGVCGLHTDGARAGLTVSYSGTFRYGPSGGGDLLGLNGATFLWQGTFDESASPYFSNGSNLDRFLGVITLTLSGTAGNDGVFTPAQESTIGEVYGDGGNDQFQLANASFFTIAGVHLWPGTMLVSPGFTGAVSPANKMTPFNTSDVVYFASWHTVIYDPSQVADYQVLNPKVVSAIPEPGTAILFSLGMAGVSAFHRIRVKGSKGKGVRGKWVRSEWHLLKPAI